MPRMRRSDASLEKKGDTGELRPVVNWKILNDGTVPNQYPLPLISKLQDRVAGAQWFTKLDLDSRFNLIRIKEEDE